MRPQKIYCGYAMNHNDTVIGYVEDPTFQGFVLGALWKK